MSSSTFKFLRAIFSKSPKNLSPPTPSPRIRYPPKIHKIVKKFKENSNYPHFRRRQDYYESAVRRLAAGKHYSAIESILEHQKNYTENMSKEAFGVRLIILYGKAGMFDHAYKVFDELPKFKCHRTLSSFNALLSAAIKSKKFDKIWEFFFELPGELGIEPDVVSYNMVIKGFCESGDFGYAMKVIEKMEGSEIRPETVSYNTVMEAYYRENKVAEAEELWQRMRRRGVIVDVWSYNSRLRGLIKNDRVQEAVKLVEKMVREGVSPDPDSHTYNALIKGCVDKGKLEVAKMFHAKMKGDRCLPDHTTYQMLIKFASDKGDIDFALELCKQSVELKVPVYRSSMQLVVDSLLNRSKNEEAKELVALVNSIKRHRYTLTLPVTTL